MLAHRVKHGRQLLRHARWDMSISRARARVWWWADVVGTLAVAIPSMLKAVLAQVLELVGLGPQGCNRYPLTTVSMVAAAAHHFCSCAALCRNHPTLRPTGSRGPEQAAVGAARAARGRGGSSRGGRCLRGRTCCCPRPQSSNQQGGRDKHWQRWQRFSTCEQQQQQQQRDL